MTLEEFKSYLDTETDLPYCTKYNITSKALAFAIAYHSEAMTACCDGCDWPTPHKEGDTNND